MTRTKKAKPAVKKVAKAPKASAIKALKKPVKAAPKAAPKVAKTTKAPKKVVKAVAKVAKVAKVVKVAKAPKKVAKVAKVAKAKKQAPISFEKQLKESAREIKALEKTLNSLHTQVTKGYKQQAALQSKLANTENKAKAKKLQAELSKLEKNLVKLINTFEDTKTDVITAKLDAEQATALLAHMDAFEATWSEEIELRIETILAELINLPEAPEAASNSTQAEEHAEIAFEVDADADEESEEALMLAFEQDYPADITSDLESEMAE